MWMMIVSAALAASPKDAKALFAEYEALGSAYDPALIELFADDGTVSVERDGTTSTLSTEEFRPVLRASLDAAKAAGDRSTYRKVKVKRNDDGFRVTAIRYSELRCYEDRDFSLQLAERDGQLKIVANHMSSVGLSQCPADPALAARLNEIQAGMPALPVQLDDNTQLDAVTVQGAALIYEQTLVSLNASDVTSPEGLQQGLAGVAVQAACLQPVMRELVKDGATARYVFSYANGDKAGQFDINHAVCTMVEKQMQQAPPPAPEVEEPPPAE